MDLILNRTRWRVLTTWGCGAPGRVALVPQQEGGMASGLGGMVAAGAGIGLGHAVVGGIANSIFGGGSE